VGGTAFKDTALVDKKGEKDFLDFQKGGLTTRHGDVYEQVAWGPCFHKKV